MDPPRSNPADETTQCDVCLETFSRSQLLRVRPCDFCTTCFETAFMERIEQALATDYHFIEHHNAYPYFRPRQFPQYFSASFMDKWDAKVAETTALNKTKVYCKHSILNEPRFNQAVVALTTGQLERIPSEKTVKCNEFLGIKQDSGTYTCVKCTGVSCARCGAPMSNAFHSCADAEDMPFKIPEGMVEGDDYTFCPKKGCEAFIIFGGACNHMKCMFCSSDFCRICGKEVTEALWGHWTESKGCPRYGLPGTEDAQYDPDDQEIEMDLDDAEEEEEEDEEHEIEEGEIVEDDPPLPRLPPTATGRANVDQALNLFTLLATVDQNGIDLQTTGHAISSEADAVRWTIPSGVSEQLFEYLQMLHVHYEMIRATPVPLRRATYFQTLELLSALFRALIGIDHAIRTTFQEPRPFLELQEIFAREQTMLAYIDGMDRRIPPQLLEDFPQVNHAVHWYMDWYRHFVAMLEEHVRSRVTAPNRV